MIKRTKSIELQEQDIKNEGNNNLDDYNRNAMNIQKNKNLSAEILNAEQKRSDNLGQFEIELSEKQINKGSIRNNLNKQNNKLPDSIKGSIVGLATGRKPKGSMTSTKILKNILDKYRDFRYAFICDICSMEYDAKMKTKIGNCEHNFCDSFLRHYVDYKISRFEEVLCPAQGCPEVIDQQSQFFKSLNSNLKEKYKKIHSFAIVSQNPNSRLCPNEKCQGIIFLQEGVTPECTTCGRRYCGKCLYPYHQGSCDKSEIDFFHKNLHYQQCTKCKSVVEKTVGCNHIKCRCGYEFCYNCGQKWWNQHKCPTGTLTAILEQPVEPIGYQERNQLCLSLQGQGIGITIARILVKIFVFFPLTLLLISLAIACMFASLGLVIVFTITMGMFPYACQFIFTNFECPLAALFIVFYPLSMICGIGLSIIDFFIQIVPIIVVSCWRVIVRIINKFLTW